MAVVHVSIWARTGKFQLVWSELDKIEFLGWKDTDFHAKIVQLYDDEVLLRNIIWWHWIYLRDGRREKYKKG